jgi:hypothetical protein
VEEGVPAVAPIPPIARWLPSVTALSHLVTSVLGIYISIYEAVAIHGCHGRLRGQIVVDSQALGGEH